MITEDQTILVDRVALVVPSCDKYSDLWDSYFRNLRSCWPDCPFEIFLVTNHLDFSSDDVEVIQVGTDRSWSANLLSALEVIPHDYVLLILDDLFFIGAIDNRSVLRLLERCTADEWDYLRLNPTPAPPGPIDEELGVGPIPPGDWYRASTQMAVWKKEVLRDVLHPAESAWELEVSGGERTDQYGRWFASSRSVLPFLNLVIKGKIDPIALRRLRSAGVQINTPRALMTRGELAGYLLRRVRSAALQAVPRRARRAVRSFFSAT